MTAILYKLYRIYFKNLAQQLILATGATKNFQQ